MSRLCSGVAVWGLQGDAGAGDSVSHVVGSRHPFHIFFSQSVEDARRKGTCDCQNVLTDTRPVHGAYVSCFLRIQVGC